MLELAICAGVMVSCLAGTVQFGYTFYVYNQLVTAVGNGGRYAAMRTYRGDQEKARSAIQNMVVYGDARPTELVPVVANLRTEKKSTTSANPTSAPSMLSQIGIRTASTIE